MDIPNNYCLLLLSKMYSATSGISVVMRQDGKRVSYLVYLAATLFSYSSPHSYIAVNMCKTEKILQVNIESVNYQKDA